MSNLGKRIITAVFLVGLIISCLFFMRDGAAELLLSLFLLVGVWEWSGFLFRARPLLRPVYTLVLAIAAAGVYAGIGALGSGSLVLWLSIAWWALAARWLVRFTGAASEVWTACAGFPVLLPAFFAVLVVLDLPRGDWLFIWIVAIVAAADIGAYFVGKLAGRRKLAPRISPGKTWEGLFGGLAAAFLVGWGGAAVLSLNVAWFAATAALAALFSVLGDLTVSAFKRQAGLKDSGVMLPGHGGVLDRIDGLVAALPLFLLALQWAGV